MVRYRKYKGCYRNTGNFISDNILAVYIMTVGFFV